MARYFLHTERFDRAPLTDEDGAEFDTLDAAIAEADSAIRELLCEVFRSDAASVPKRIAVIDASGRELHAIEAIELVPWQLRRH